MEGFRTCNVSTLEAKFPRFGDKLEKVVYKAAVHRISPINPNPSMNEFRIVYNYVTQVVLDDANFVGAVTSGQEKVKPLDLMNVLVVRREGEDLCETPELDSRIAMRMHTLRQIRMHLKDDLAVRTEKSIAKHKISKKHYKRQALCVLANLKNEKTKLKDRLSDGTFSAEDIGNATRKDFWPELWQQANMQAGHKATIISNEDDMVQDTLIKCQNCKSHTVQTRELQTRSSDEPMTIFCNCTTCGKRWKM